jgi:hypothetical protein
MRDATSTGAPPAEDEPASEATLAAERRERRRRRRRRLLVALPFLTFVVLVGAWTIAWFVIRAEVAEGFERWLARERAEGLAHECAERSVVGYPFRIEIRCLRPVLIVRTPQGLGRLRAAAISGTALLYRAEHVLIDVVAPFVVEQNGADQFRLNFRTARASYRARQGSLERLDLLIERPVLVAGGGGRPDIVADRVELHTRHDPSVTSEYRDFDLAVSATAVAPAGSRPEQGAALSLEGRVMRWPFTAPPGPDGAVADWARARGSFDGRELRVTRGQGLLTASGTLSFDAAGYPEGRFRAFVAEPRQLLAAVPGVGDPGAVIAPALALVGRAAEAEGRRGTELQVRVEAGAVSIGTFSLGRLAPAY